MRRGGGGFMNGFIGFIVALVLLALGLAICRAFNYDPLDIIRWLVNAFEYVVSRLADVIGNSRLFRAVFH